MKKPIPFSFVLDELAESHLARRVRTKAMFGSHAVYVDEKIVFILRSKGDAKTSPDNGVWVAMLPEHSESVRRDYPILRPIEMFAAKAFAGWLNAPAESDSFEETALALCGRVIAGDARIGKMIKPKKARKKS